MVCASWPASSRSHTALARTAASGGHTPTAPGACPPALQARYFRRLIRLQARPDCSGVATAATRVARPPPPHPGALCKGYKVHRTNHVGVRARAILKRDRVRRIATDHDAAQAIIISILLQQHERRVGQLISMPRCRAWV